MGNEKLRSSLTSQRVALHGNAFRGNGNAAVAGLGDNMELLTYDGGGGGGGDRLSISSYGSHKNRTFNVGSHMGSLHSIDGPNHFDLLQLAPADAFSGGRRSSDCILVAKEYCRMTRAVRFG